MFKIIVLILTVGLGVCFAQADQAAIHRHDFRPDTGGDNLGSRVARIPQPGTAA